MPAEPTPFGMLLRRYRERAGLGQEQLAAHAGLSAKGIGALERGKRQRPHPHTLQQLAQALDLSEHERAAFFAAAAPQETARELQAEALLPQAPALIMPELPTFLTPLVGRERELAAALAFLEHDVRLLTLTGPGGVGKTRLAVQIAQNSRSSFAGGVVFVPLAGLADPKLVLLTIAQTLGLREHREHALPALLLLALRHSRLLLVLDNFEHLLPATSAVVDLLKSCPLLSILVTSRASLRVDGEQEYAVPPLALPDPDCPPLLNQVAGAPALLLFVQRAQCVRPDFALTQANVAATVAICHRLDGLPLAIELAAARIKLLPPKALLARLDRALSVLVGGGQLLPARQQTMRSTIAWSYTLLDVEERQLFRRLAIFVGGWTLEAAEAVTVLPDEPRDVPERVLNGLASLVDKSLVVRLGGKGPAEEDQPRFTMLATLRAYGLEQLIVAGEETMIRARHAHYFLGLDEQAQPELVGDRPEMWLTRLEREPDDLRAALHWLLEHGEVEAQLRLSATLTQFWFFRGYLSDGRRWVGDHAAAERLNEAGLALARQEHNLQAVAAALMNLGSVAWYQSAYTRARSLYEESVVLLEQLGDYAGTAWSLYNLALLGVAECAYDRALALAQSCLSLSRAHAFTWITSAALNILGLIALHQGAYQRAFAYCTESLAINREYGMTPGILFNLHILACLAAVAGELQRAGQLWGAAMANLDALGTTLSTMGHAQYDRYIDAAKALIGEAAWEMNLAEGRTLSVEQAIAMGRATHVMA